MNPPSPKQSVREKMSTFAKVFACVTLGILLTGATILLARYIPLD